MGLILSQQQNQPKPCRKIHLDLSNRKRPNYLIYPSIEILLPLQKQVSFGLCEIIITTKHSILKIINCSSDFKFLAAGQQQEIS